MFASRRWDLPRACEIPNFEVDTVNPARILRKLLAARGELRKTPPQSDIALGELDHAIQEIENGPALSDLDDGPLLRGEGPTSRKIGIQTPSMGFGFCSANE